MSKGNRTRRRDAGLLPMPQKCSARTRNGDPCRAAPVRGATVCRMHGGAAPQVKAKAAQRLAERVMPMLATLDRIANDESLPPAVRLAAVRDWLDRAGIKEAIALEIAVQPWEHVLHIDGLVSEMDTDKIQPWGTPRDLSVIDHEPVAAPAEDVPASPPRIPSRRQRGAATFTR